MINKKILTLQFTVLFLIGFSILPSHAFRGRYGVYTHMKDINTLKKKSFRWYENNVDKKKFYFGEYSSGTNHHVADKEISYLKAKSLRWYGNNVNDGKFYFGEYSSDKNRHVADKEIAYLKNRSFRWYSKDSWE